MSLNSRLQIFLEKKGLTAMRFEQLCGLSNGAASKLSDNTRRSTFSKIADAFPDLNIEWLRTGVGEMLLKTSASIKPTEENEADDPDLVPLLPVEAMAGSLQLFSQGVELRDCRKIKSPVQGADWAIQISGDSMEPDFKNGSYLFIRKMTGAFIPWGHTLVIDTYDGVVVKKIYPSEEGSHYIEARSINPHYPPFQIEKTAVIGLYRVLGGTFINSTM